MSTPPKSQLCHRTFVLRKKEKRWSLLLKYAYLSRPTRAPGWCRTGTNPYPHHKDSKSLRIHFSIPIKLLFVFNLSNLTLQHARYNGWRDRNSEKIQGDLRRRHKREHKTSAVNWKQLTAGERGTCPLRDWTLPPRPEYNESFQDFIACLAVVNCFQSL